LDRVVVRSSRSLDLAEQGIRALARSRADSRRDIDFRPIGESFRQARQHAREIVDAFRRDAFEAPDGHFARLVLRPPIWMTRNVAGLEPRAVEARLEAAVRALLARERPQGQGVYVIRHEISRTGALEPAARVHLSKRQADGGSAPAFSRAARERIEERWLVEATRAFGYARDVRERDERERTPVSEPRPDRVVEIARLRVIDGARYLDGSLETRRREILEEAIRGTAALPAERERSVSAVVWQAGADLHAAVYANEPRAQDDREPADSERFRAALAERLRAQIVRAAVTLEPAREGRIQDLGPVRVADPAHPDRARVLAAARGPQAGERLAIRMARETPPERLADTVTRRQEGQENAPGWQRDRLAVVHLRIAIGAAEIGRHGLEPAETARVLQRAIHRTYPFLEREGIRDNFVYAARGRALDVRVLVPERLGWTADELRSPQFQQRFIAGFNQALTQVGRARVTNERQPVLTTMARSVGTARYAPQLIRQAEQDPERAAKQAARMALERLTGAMPRVLRLARDAARAIGRSRSDE
jgi:hypothetical protein